MWNGKESGVSFIRANELGVKALKESEGEASIFLLPKDLQKPGASSAHFCM